MSPRSDDEETLKLKLAHIQTQLRLKRLQNKNKRKLASPEPPLHVPQSPSPSPKRTKPAASSPARILLRVDKGKTAKDISLRSPPKLPLPASLNSPQRPLKSFAQRLQEAQDLEKRAREKEESRRTNQTKGFSLASRSPCTQLPLPAVEPFSGIPLSSALLSPTLVHDQLHGKHLFPLHRLLKQVTSPEYDPPDVDGDWVVLGIVASKSPPRETKNGSGKWCAILLTDLKWEIELYLFGGAFERHWKVQPGMVVALLNPGLLKPRQQGKSFSLNLSEKEDTLLEIGKAKDLGFCKSVKKDGKLCGTWVDLKHTEYCEFHVDAGLKKTRSKRMEIATGSRMFSPPKSIAARKSGYSGTSNFHENPFAGTADVQIRLASSQTFVVGPKHQMFDQDGKDSNHLRLAKFRKQQATRERERQVVHKLLQSQNNSVASDYFNAGKQDPVPLDESLNPFSAIALRKIGFDPRRRVGSIPDITKKMTLDEFMRTSPVGIDGDSSDELEIV